MDQSSPLTAAEVLNTYPAERIAQVLREYGEERFARRIADAVVKERSRAPLTSTARLVEIIRDSIPRARQADRRQPGQADFPALRIEVNGELDVLRAGPCPRPWTRLAVGGRIVVLAYHSLEDRAVKTTLASASADTHTPGLPISRWSRGGSAVPGCLTRGSQRPSGDEVVRNPRAPPPACGRP